MTPEVPTMTVPRSGFHSTTLGLALALAVVATATRSHAADIGHCDTPENITALLKAEGQRSVAMARQVDTGHAVIFTAGNGAGTVLLTDQPPGIKAGRICVADRLRNVTLRDARRPGVPELPTVNGNQAARCATLAKQAGVDASRCGDLKTMLTKVELLGERVMLSGTTRDGVLVTATANLSTQEQRGGLLYTWLPEGATMIGRVFTGTAYTEAALQLLEATNRTGR